MSVQILEIRGRVQTMSGPVDVLLDFDEATGHAEVFRVAGDEAIAGDPPRVVFDDYTTGQIGAVLERAALASTT